MAIREAFTLLEVLVSITILGFVILALFSAVDVLKDSNEHFLGHLKKSKEVSQTTKTLYLDILSSDGDIEIKKDEFTQLCMGGSIHSLYALPMAKVCWLVLKEENTLVRVEGNNYTLPLKLEQYVEVDATIKNMEVFDVYHEKDKVLVLLQQRDQEPISFMIQGISAFKKDSNATKKPK